MKVMEMKCMTNNSFNSKLINSLLIIKKGNNMKFNLKMKEKRMRPNRNKTKKMIILITGILKGLTRISMLEQYMMQQQEDEYQSQVKVNYQSLNQMQRPF